MEHPENQFNLQDSLKLILQFRNAKQNSTFPYVPEQNIDLSFLEGIYNHINNASEFNNELESDLLKRYGNIKVSKGMPTDEFLKHIKVIKEVYDMVKPHIIHHKSKDTFT